MPERLSPRLTAVAEMIPCKARVVDVGTDHGLVPTYLVQQSLVQFAIASDISEGPCSAARRTVSEHGLVEQVSVRLGPGLTTVQEGEVDTVIMAGMGGATAIQILDESEEVVGQLERIVIQPMNASCQVRMELYERGFDVERESIVNEDGRLYEVISFCRGKMGTKDPAYLPFPPQSVARECAFTFGPLNLREKGPEVIRLAQSTLERWRSASAGMKLSQEGLTHDKRRKLDEKINWMADWLLEATSKDWGRAP